MSGRNITNFLYQIKIYEYKFKPSQIKYLTIHVIKPLSSSSCLLYWLTETSIIIVFKIPDRLILEYIQCVFWRWTIRRIGTTKKANDL